MAEDYYAKQCRFEQPNEDGNGVIQRVGWIDEKGAKVGTSLTFKDDKESGRWTVVSVGSRKHIAYLRERSVDHKNTRKVSDIGRDGTRQKIGV